MKVSERISILANVLEVACSRPNNEVGKLVKAVVSYANEGIRPALDDIRLETYFDLIAHDLDTQRNAAEVKSRKCSESAKCRTVRNGNSTNSPARRTNAANAATSKQKADANDDGESPTDDTSSIDDGSEDSCDAAEPILSSDFYASDATSSFEQMKAVYVKLGNNESQAFEVWKQLPEDERTAAFAHVQLMQGDPASRNYLFVYLRDREWTKAVSSK